MNLQFFDQSQHITLAAASDAGAVRTIFLPDTANPKLTMGQAADTVLAIKKTAVMLTGTDFNLRFVLTDDSGFLLDIE
jgi:hypothetical protein